MKFKNILLLGILAILFLTTVFFSGITTVEKNNSVLPEADLTFMENYLIAGPLVFLTLIIIFMIVRKRHQRSP
ncbi:uncharacterized BrkB/YihY/UPF0761 family membrane protein [Methanohalophilus levihalophilus]|uniref:hypothetical protein n=1 Tax=Methanohalophilus levihalophilus TaxID=1431282 RepID=UPI001AEB5A5F|nr:hypothetical protein [Methanohalophilus levihalophilus]MBP2029554.1 uncharacterized BrkB/YihY/UPF0761 family membrane protein [Methanohalophilus levihalophilus]